MFLKKFKKTLYLILLSLFIMPINILAYSTHLIPGGENIGIELNATGIHIVGLYKVNDVYPAYEAGLEVGDVITSVDNQKVATINELVTKINNNFKESINITYMRNNIEKTTSLKLFKDESGIFKTGMYVKDSIMGIGTLTFIDPSTKKFGVLGHEIIEKTSGKRLDIKNGKIFSSFVTNIQPSVNGVPGEKNARYDSNEIIGTIYENTIHGIFGNYDLEIPEKKLYKVAKPNEIRKGEASILTVLNGKEIAEYSINIIKVNNSAKQTTKNILFEIDDNELLKLTGGIIQGMSGSPILQGENIIGAVTHVVVDNPTRGYGIFITNMLEEAEN